MMRSQPIVRSVLCCLLCLTVCAVPALAGNEQYTDGFFYWSNGAQIIGTVGSKSVDFLSGHFPASISSDDANTINDDYRNFTVSGVPVDFGTSGFLTWSYPSLYVEVLFAVPAPLKVTVGGLTSSLQATVEGCFRMVGVDPDGSYSNSGTTPYASRIDCVFDAEYIPTTGTSSVFNVTSGSYDVQRYFGFRYYFDSFNETKPIKRSKWLLRLNSDFNGKYTFSDPDYVHGIFNEVTVNSGVLQEINGKLTEIQTSTTQIQNDVSEIKNGLQDSNSSIWGAFKDSVSGLFVPSSGDLEGVKNGFDQLAQDKLGGAYQSFDTVIDGVQTVNNKFKNPGSSPGVEFPGISVPLGGDVGTVTLAASQTVTLPEKITGVLYPVAGVIIPIVCAIWTIRQCLEMLEYFMSGMSYAEYHNRYLHEEDD